MSAPTLDLVTMKFLAGLGDVIEEHAQPLWDQHYETFEIRVSIGDTVYVYYEEGWQIGE